jgi:diacylglycerol kinase (ATP)
MTNACLIFNPNAGRARSHKITEEILIQDLRERGVEITEIHVDDMAGIPGFVESLASESLLIMAGGDGTLYEVVQLPACRRLTLGIVPLGTENNLAMAAGIPMNIDSAMHAAANGRECLVDLGCANGGMFTQAAGVGFHAEAFRLYGEHQPRSLARAGKVILQALAEWESQPMSVNVDGVVREIDAVQVTVANTPIYGKAYPIAPDAGIRDGWLDIVEIQGCKPRLELAGCIVDFMEGRELDSSKVTRVRGRHIEIIPLNDAVIPAHADSEPIGYAPVTIEVVPACLRLRVPE